MLENNEIRDLAEFRRWVRIRLAEKEMSQRDLARQMNIPQPRICEATHGKQSGKKYIIPVIRALDGDEENFKEFLRAI